MKYTTFIAEVKENNSVEIPVETRDRLDIRSGDKIEVTVTKIKTKRLEILISKNPLHKLLKFTE
jgi:bifunctional DNA-binding transcriptional regulator/antitoxin component of YhaV-PrlF toxin-antitoxin module